MRSNLGWSEHQQVGESERQFAASSASSRMIAVSSCDASRGGPPSWRDAHHRERLEREAERGRTAVLESSATRSSAGTRCRAASRADLALEGRSPRARLCYRAVDFATGRQAHREADRSAVQRGPGVAHPYVARLQLPTPLGVGARTQRNGDLQVEAAGLAGANKNAAKQWRTIVFIDESGLSERLTSARTWAPRGHTPVLHYPFNWHHLSVIAGISFTRFYFRLFAGAIKRPQIVEFINALGRRICRPLLVIWDGLPAHRIAAHSCASTWIASMAPCRSSKCRATPRN